MTKIGVLSDTHGFVDQALLNFFADCQEIWHAGDVGDETVISLLSGKHLFRGVHGNIDDWEIMRELPRFQEFTVEGMSVLMTHIGYQYGRFPHEVVLRLNESKPGIFVCGHSHILKVHFDKSRKMLCINPGAAGLQGIHQVRTAVRFDIHDDRIENLDLLELPKTKS